MDGNADGGGGEAEMNQPEESGRSESERDQCGMVNRAQEKEKLQHRKTKAQWRKHSNNIDKMCRWNNEKLLHKDRCEN